MMAESHVIAPASECKHNKWHLSFEVNVVLWMQMVAFPLPITAFRLLVQLYNDVLNMTTLDVWYLGFHRSTVATPKRNCIIAGKQDIVR